MEQVRSTKQVAVMDDPTDLEKARKSGPPRDEKGRLLKGSGSLNPGGRPRGIRTEALKYAGENGEHIFEFLWKIVRGEIPAPVAQRVDAAKEILIRSHGKAPDIALNGELDGDAVKALSDLGDENVSDLLEALKKSA